jgi:hypothetical protein
MTNIPLRVGSNPSDSTSQFELVFEAEAVTTYNVAGTAVLTINASLKAQPHQSVDFARTRPTLFDLYGTLVYEGLSIQMRPLMPSHVGVLGSYPLPLALAFELTHSQLHYLENERLKKGQNAHMVFALHLHGRVIQHAEENNEGMSFYFSDISSPSISMPNSTFRIARSDWHETILPGLGYDQTLMIELPLPRYNSVPDEVTDAVRHLSVARQHLRDERYREAVHSCRDAKDALIRRAPDAILNMLEPLLGSRKAATVDKALRSFGDLYTSSSHPATLPKEERIEFTHDDATFAVNSLTFILDYIAHVLQAQGVATP